MGYDIEAPMSTFYTLPAVGSDVRLLTHLVVREDAHILYGFGTQEERALFRNLLKVSGVGPKIALAILSGVSVEGFATCVKLQDAAALTQDSRRGPQDRRTRCSSRCAIGSMRSARPPPPARRCRMARTQTEGEAWSALVALGYKPAEVTQMLKPFAGPGGSTEDLIRRALAGHGASAMNACRKHDPIASCRPRPSKEEEAIDRAIRPKRLADYVGQEQVKAQLEIFVKAAVKRGEALDHALIFGPPGLGKTTLANILASELGREPAPDLGSGARASRRSRRAADQSAAARRAVHRRDPPALARGRRSAVSGDGGLSSSTS